MSLEEVKLVDQITVVENGSVQVREATRIMKDGEMIAQTYHRHVIAPGDDYSNEDEKVQAICAAAHTEEVVAAYQAMMAANNAGN